jgi:hypothetical protein
MTDASSELDLKMDLGEGLGALMAIIILRVCLEN